jgi:hypothetical protein
MHLRRMESRGERMDGHHLDTHSEARRFTSYCDRRPAGETRPDLHPAGHPPTPRRLTRQPKGFAARPLNLGILFASTLVCSM